MYTKLFASKKKADQGKRPFGQLLLGIIILCIAIYCLLLRNSKINHLTWAQENLPVKSTKLSSAAQEQGNELVWNRIQELQDSLKKKEVALEKQNSLLNKKEQQLALIKQEIIEQIETLQSLQKEIEQDINQLNERDEKRIQKILKLFERTPMDQACAIISDLAKSDISTVIEIIMRMEKTKAKRLWENVNPELGAKITKLMMEKSTVKK